jgi:hypothetical protein
MAFRRSNHTRSSMFAFKCMIGTSLTRIDINATSRTNLVKQLFISKEGETHLVCLRLRKAISRGQFARMLEAVESNMRTAMIDLGIRNHLRPPSGIVHWEDTVFMGEELRDGEGDVIRQTLKRHMEEVNPQYSESHSTTMRHITHMLRDSIRPNPNQPSRLVEVASSIASSSRDSRMAIELDDNNNDPQPRLCPAGQNEGEAQPAVGPPSSVFRPAPIIEGQPIMVEPTMTTMLADIVRIVLQVGPDFNLQQRFDNIDARIGELIDIVRRTRDELARN